MVADVPVGAFISGGLDSGAIAKFAQDSLGEGKLQCFTIGFEDKQYRSEGFGEDLPYARKLADFLGVDLHVVTAGPEMMDYLQDMTYYLDEPQADPAAINALFISRLAQKLGLKVLLSGAGGDDIFTGYRRHYALSLEKYWEWLPRKIRFGLQRLAQLSPVAHPAGRRLAKAFQYASLEKDERIVSYFFWTSPKLMPLLFSAEFLLGISKGQPAAPLLNSLLCLPGNTSPLNRMLFLEGKHFLADHNLNYTDKMGMVAGVEIRVPLLDPDLIALAAHLPDRYKQNGTVGKWIFKKAMEAHLPKEIIYRPKAGFGVPLRRWLHGGLRPMVDELLSARVLRARGIFEPTGVAKLLEMDRNGEIDGAYTIFSIMSIELWCRNFLDANRFHGSDRF
jgi:asparagine synthase (glutamine-hydrolysing)